MSVSSTLWSELIALNKHADALVERCQRAIEPTQPTGREIPFFGSIENRFDDLPSRFLSTVPPSSMVLAGNNVRRQEFTNGGSRVYVRELSFQTWFMVDADDPTTGNERTVNNTDVFPFNFYWNFQTSITQRWYSDKRVLAAAGGRQAAGNHLAFREPLIIEPRETFVFECELASYGMRPGSGEDTAEQSAIVAMILSGYREGV